MGARRCGLTSGGGYLILVKSASELARMEAASRIVAETLDVLQREVAVGVTTHDLDRIAEEHILSQGGRPAFKGYGGYPATICASVNEQVIHGIPSRRNKLREGDIIGIDLGVIYEGFVGDAARTFPVGSISPEAERLVRVTEEALALAMAEARDGKRVSDIGHAVQGHVEAAGYSVVRSFVGHGIGKKLHEEPQVPNFGPPGKGPRLRSGMTLAIEPMVNAGGYEVKVLGDGWTAVTADGSLSAHCEHTVVVTPEGGQPLTVTG
jgi:methionyl aminopeptidase